MNTIVFHTIVCRPEDSIRVEWLNSNNVRVEQCILLHNISELFCAAYAKRQIYRRKNWHPTPNFIEITWDCWNVANEHLRF
jgi:hypothetical protein